MRLTLPLPIRNRINWKTGSLVLWAGLLVLIARPVPSTLPTINHEAPRVSLEVTSRPLLPSTRCSSQFVTHKLDFSTGTRLREIGTYISNGAGVAVNDLDADGDLDLVFASVDAQSAILWNQGNLKFEEERIDDKFTRGVAIVDVDGDGWLDLVFTHRGLEPPSFWHNRSQDKETRRQGDKETEVISSLSPSLPLSPSIFVRTPLPGVVHYAYAMGWADLDGDGALDLVTGSYGAELKQHGIKEPEKEAKAGIVLYLRRGEHYDAYKLDTRSEALSIGLVDLDGDQRLDIWVANDFSLQDLVWVGDGKGWKPATPFKRTSHSTMSIDWGDLGNNGRLALFTTDMNPYNIAPETMAQWLPMMAKMGEHRAAGDPQIMANVLQLRNRRGQWVEQANALGVSATGWSWAGRFGDLDNDGHLDLYVVNGMIANDMFGHLTNGELIEENQAFRNQGDGTFTRAAQWNLASTASGRGMVMADMDGDSDLDIVVNNLRGLAELHENQLCTGSNLQVELRWSGSSNPFAIGAQVMLHTSAGILRRDVRASGGYLSGDAARVHFGLPTDVTLERLEIIWPDGGRSSLHEVAARSVLLVVR